MKIKTAFLGLSAGLFALASCTHVQNASIPTATAATPAAPVPASSPAVNPPAAANSAATRSPGGPRPPAPIPENLDPASAAAEAAAMAGPVSWAAAPAATSTTLPTPFDSTKHLEWAATPPMGWNSWDGFGAGVWQDDVLANADYMEKNLKAHGWNLITIDIQWYEPLAHTGDYREGAWLMTDANGRLHPAPNRFPLTKDTGSFKPIADILHAQGLKFGLHLMRGIPRQAVDRDNTPILGTPYHAQDIADKQNVCFWNHDMYGVDMSKPGAQEYYNSVFKQMADWGLDFVKVDDLSGHPAEIEAVRKAIDQCGRPMVFSISPGGSSNDEVATNANLWRISGDFWDNWRSLYNQFSNCNAGTPFRGPGHWPDADMIPFGNIRTYNRNDHWTHFTKDEQYTLMTLWCIARSPLILGADLPNNDDFTLSLLTNDEVLAVNQDSTNNRQLFNQNNQVAWVADVPDSPDKYLAIFNTSPAPPPGRGRGRRGGLPPGLAPGGTPGNNPASNPMAANSTATAAPAASTAAAIAPAAATAATEPVTMAVTLSDLGLKGSVTVRDLWAHQDLGVMTDAVTATVNSHGAVLYRVSPAR
jgi:alpha-galactosidase